MTALLFAAAAAVYLWPIAVSKPSQAAVAMKSTAVTPPKATDTTDAHVVVSANILSASRRTPSRRYVSPEVASPTDLDMPAAFEPATMSVATDSTGSESDGSDTIPALYGIVNSGGVWQVLVRLSLDDATPTLLKEGDKRGSYRIVSIRANAVVVAGPSGQRTLRLARMSRGDSSGKNRE